jgi:hypothetical protein
MHQISVISTNNIKSGIEDQYSIASNSEELQRQPRKN